LLVVARIAEPKSIDPATVTVVYDVRILMNVCDEMVRYRSRTLEVEPGLEPWTISDDGKVYTCSLRQGIKFLDGSPFNAEAVKFNFDRMLVKDNTYAETGPFHSFFLFSDQGNNCCR
jgi:peptide/nickel transport system substrate-binding protein